MGVLGWFRRSADTSPKAAEAVTRTVDAEGAEAAAGPGEARKPQPSDGGPAVADGPVAEGAAAGHPTAGDRTPDAAGGIPKQQSARDAADSEAGEGARH